MRSTNRAMATTKPNLVQDGDTLLAHEEAAVNNPMNVDTRDMIRKMPYSTFHGTPQLLVTSSILIAIGTSKEKVPATIARSTLETSWKKQNTQSHSNNIQ